MVEWIILAVIVVIVTLIMLIPVGADIRYEDGVVRLSAKAAWIRLQLIPNGALSCFATSIRSALIRPV